MMEQGREERSQEQQVVHLGVRDSKDGEGPKPLCFFRSQAPKSALGAAKETQGRKTPLCSPCFAPARHKPWGRWWRSRGGHARLSLLPTPGSRCWQAARAAFQDPASLWPPSPAPQDTAQQTVMCLPLCGLLSYDPTQGACERSSSGQVSPRFCFPFVFPFPVSFCLDPSSGFQIQWFSLTVPSGTVRKR